MSEINTAATNIYDRLRAAPTFHPANADLFTDWNMQAGDVVTVKSDAESYQVPIYNMKLKWTGKPKVAVESTGNPEREPLPAIKRREYGANSSNYSSQKRLGGGLGAAQKDIQQIIGDVTGVKGDITEIKGTGVLQNSERITQVAGKFTVDSAGNVHVIDGSNLYLGEGLGSLAVYTSGNLTAGAIVEKINNGQSTILANKLNVNTTDVAAWGAYTNNTLTGGILVEKLNDNSTTTQILGSRINARATDLATWGVYTNDTLTAGIIVDKINNGSVTIRANKINLEGYVTATQFEAEQARLTNIVSGNTSVAKIVGVNANFSDLIVTNSILYGPHNVDLTNAVATIGPATASGGEITIPWTMLNGTAGESVNFNIADTQYYKNGVSAAWTNAYNTVRINNNKNPGAGNKTINLGSGQSVEVYAQAKDNANASIWTTVGTVTVNAPTYTLGSLSISSNGIYNAPTYGYTGFSYVSVDVPSSSVQFGSVRSRSVAAVGASVYVNYSLDGGNTWRSYTATVQEYTG